MSDILECRQVIKTFRSGFRHTSIQVLDRVDLRLCQGETLGLMGPSGCGKSTLARILLRLIPCDEGTVLFQGQDITHLSGQALLPFRRQVQLISQRPETFFDPRWTFQQSLEEPLDIFHIQGDRRAMVSELLDQVKLTDELLTRRPHQVSGGEIQRLALVRALLLQPKVLVLDEATSMLDISVQAQILQILKEVRQRYHLSCLFITHDRDVAEYMCDRIQTLPVEPQHRLAEH